MADQAVLQLPIEHEKKIYNCKNLTVTSNVSQKAKNEKVDSLNVPAQKTSKWVSM